MAIVSTPQTVRLSGSLTIEPAIPIVGGTESAVVISEAFSAKSVSEQVFTLAASDAKIINPSVILNSDIGFIMVQATSSVSVSCPPFAALGTLIIVKPVSNAFANFLTITNNSSTSTVTVRVILGAYS